MAKSSGWLPLGCTAVIVSRQVFIVKGAGPVSPPRGVSSWIELRALQVLELFADALP